MPLSFSISSDKNDVYGRIGSPSSPTATIERVILEEGISIYDAALWQIVLNATHDPQDRAQAMQPVMYYWNGSLENLINLRTGTGASAFVYDPIHPEEVTSQLGDKGRRGFIFRIIDAHGAYLMPDPLDGQRVNEDFPNDPRIHWEDWKPIAGENAWVVLAALHLYKDDPENEVALRLAEELARAAMYLQADNGGIRMAPLGTYCHLLNIDPGLDEAAILQEFDRRSLAFKTPGKVKRSMVRLGGRDYPDYHVWYYEEISTENNLSWYAALRMLYALTGKPEYRTAMDRIEGYFKSVWNSQDNVFYQGTHHTRGRWVPNADPFAEDVQSWSILVLGPRVIDGWFGEGTAYRIWRKTRGYAGVFSSDGELQGVGFTKENDRVSIEWTAGAIMAVRQLADHYAFTHPQWREGLEQDARSMRAGIDQYRFTSDDGTVSYAYSSRRGWIPFGWFSQDPRVQSLASSAWVALIDAHFNPFELSFVPPAPSAIARIMDVEDFLRYGLRQAVARSCGLCSFGFFTQGYFQGNFLLK